MSAAENRTVTAGSPVSSSTRAMMLAPMICAAAYPYVSQLFSATLVQAHGSATPEGGALGLAVVGSVVLAFGIMAVSFRIAQSAADTASRLAAHLAFATPSLFVGFGNVANLWRTPGAALIAWPLFWAAIAVIVMSPRNKAARRQQLSQAAYQRLGMAHGISAALIVGMFVAAHLANHAMGLWSGAAHLDAMKLGRLLYRSPVVEPVLLTLIAFQLASGGVLVRRKLGAGGTDFYATLQTMTGVYVGIYFLAHLTAVFSARYAGTDTDWNWLTNHDRSMLASLSSLRLIAHYWFGPVAIMAHLGCGLRIVLRGHHFSSTLADALPRATLAAGAVISSVILAGLLGIHTG